MERLEQKSTIAAISREDTKVIKGVAIFLMLMHHLWAFPNRIYGGGLLFRFWFLEQPATVFFGYFGNVCVPIFFFLGGYGTYLGQRGKRYDLIDRLKKLYISYWKVFLVFIPIAFLFFAHQPAYAEEPEIYACYSKFTWHEFLSNFLGLSSSYNREWWFLASYVTALITFPVIRAAVRNKSLHTNLLLIVIASILVTNVFPAIGRLEEIGGLNGNYLYARFFCQAAPFVACFWMGIVAAENDLLDRLRTAMDRAGVLKPLIDLAIWFGIIYVRQYVAGATLDIFYIPVLCVVSLDILSHLRGIRKVFLKLGQESTNMWLIHSFFCYYFLAAVKLVVAPKWAVPSLLVLVAFTYLASVFLTWFWKEISVLFRKVQTVAFQKRKEN